MFRRTRRALFVALTLAVLGVPMACGSWQATRSPHLESRGDAASTYVAVKKVLTDGKYHLVEQKDSERKIVARSHVDEESASTYSFITIVTASDGKVTFTPSGYLVKSDGRIHRKLNAEIDAFNKAISEKLGATPASVSSQPSASADATAAPTGSVAAAWNEPAYDPKIWGPGDFTCLPVKIPAEDQGTLKLKLANGEEADLVLSLAYAPELCRSPKQCPLPTGCPALGFGDAQQVNKLAKLLVEKQVGEKATVLHRGQPVVTIDLTAHGLIAKAIAQIKPTEPAPTTDKKPPTPPVAEKKPESKSTKTGSKASGTGR